MLILFGGLVTNTGAALAVPDWPTTFGQNMFLYPWSAMVGGIFYEHSHRLIGAVVGCLTIAMAVAAWPRGGVVRTLGLVAVGAVVLQGVLGGLRVILLEPRLAVIHGCLAQAFFALVVALVAVTLPRHAIPTTDDRSLRVLTWTAAGLVYVQMVFGALLTHAGRLDLHLVGALAVVGFVPIVTARLRRTAVGTEAWLARALAALVGIQLVLGAGSLVARLWGPDVLGGSLVGLGLPVVHRLTGSLVLGASVFLAVAASSRRGAVRVGRRIESQRGAGPIGQLDAAR